MALLSVLQADNRAGNFEFVALNHLGVEVATPEDVAEHQARLAGDGIDSVEENGTCCFALQEKVWVDGPDGAWEVYAVLADSEDFGEISPDAHLDAADALCCDSVPESAARCCS